MLPTAGDILGACMPFAAALYGVVAELSYAWVGGRFSELSHLVRTTSEQLLLQE